jgi:hypothetical protein
MRPSWGLLSAVVIFINSFCAAALAQSGAPVGQRTFQSSGLKASIVRTSMGRQGLSVQMLVENVSNSRQYVLVPSDVYASSDRGSQFQLKSVAGIGHTNQNTNCLFSICASEASDLNRYSYIEPGQSVAFSMNYHRPSGRSSDFGNLISFMFKALVRTSPPAGGLNPEAAGRPGPAHIVTINFPLVPLQND